MTIYNSRNSYICCRRVPLAGTYWEISKLLSIGFSWNIPDMAFASHSNCLSRTGIFHVLFALFFIILTILILQDLILSNIPCSFRTISPAHSIQQVTENMCIESHNVADTMFILQRAARFETRWNTSSIVRGLKPRQDDRLNYLLQDRRIRPIVMNWHFSRYFRLIFSQHLRSLSFKILSYQPHHTHSKPFRLFTLFTDNEKTRVLNPWRSWHNVYTTTGDPFQANTKHKLYSMRIKPPARPSKTTLPPGSENPPYHSSRSWPRCLPHHQPYGWSTLSWTGIFHVLFTFYFITLTLIIIVQSLIPNTNSHSLLSISSSYFVSDHQENQKRVYSVP